MLKKIFTILLFVTVNCLIFSLKPVLASGFAPWAKLDPSTRAGRLSSAMRSKVKHIPSREELSMPVYPDLKITGYRPPLKDSSDSAISEDKKTLPVFILASKSSTRKIIEFYTAHLKGYKHVSAIIEKSGTYNSFIKMTDADKDVAKLSHLSSMEKMMTPSYHPSVSIFTTTGRQLKILKNIKAVVSIAYRPKSD